MLVVEDLHAMHTPHWAVGHNMLIPVLTINATEILKRGVIAKKPARGFQPEGLA